MLHDRFVDAIHSRDRAMLHEALAPDVRFFSPVVFRPTRDATSSRRSWPRER